MKTKEMAVSEIVSNIATLRDVDSSDAPSMGKIHVFANRYYDSACAQTGYPVLPDTLISYVEEAVLQAWSKRGTEGLNMQTAAGVSEQYLDVEYALKTNLKGKHNPLSTVYLRESAE